MPAVPFVRLRSLLPVAVIAILAGTISLVLIHPAAANPNPHPSSAAVGGVAQAGGPARAAAAPPSGFLVAGIDVSKWQGSVNWTAVAAKDKFAYVKATEGTTYLSDTFATQYKGAKAAGLYVGAYAFGRPDSPALPQADYFIAHSSYAADGKTLPPMLDLEWPYEINNKFVAPYPCYGLSPAQMVTWIRVFVNEVHRLTGSATMIYTTANWWNGCTGNTTAFADQYLDVASFTAAPPTMLPTGFEHWTMWQYASSGSLPGDQDVFAGSLDQMTAYTPTAKCARIPSDFNGDGYADVAVGEPGRAVNGHTGAGAIRIFYGGPHGPTGVSQYIDPTTVGIPAVTGGAFGTSVAAGYFDGTCTADLAVGSPGTNTVTVLTGSPKGLLTSGAITLTGRTSGSRFGAALAAADLTGDSYPDLAIGAPAAAGNTGEVAVAAGGAAGLTVTPNWITETTPGVPGVATSGDLFGAALVAGNISSTDHADLIVGEPGKTVSGAAAAGAAVDLPNITGAGATEWSQATAGVPGVAETGDQFGAALAVGDITGDGHDDLAIGDPREDVGSTVDAGSVTILPGTSTGLTATGAQLFTQDTPGVPGIVETSDQFGAALTLGDITGDGHDDLVVGDPRENDGTIIDGGSVTRLHGTAAGLTTTDAQLFTQNTSGVPGTTIHSGLSGAAVLLATINSGYATLIVGTPGYGSGHPGSGAITTIPGTAGGLTVTGSTEYTESGLTPGIASHDNTGAGLG